MQSIDSLHKKFMRLAIEEAKKGRGHVSPNPAVGCIIVKDGKVIAKGYHKIFGGPHAEIVALSEAGERANGATMYVTLEPCCYFGKTPPCTDAIIRSGIKEVIAAIADPNPANSGKGFKLLRKKGIKVFLGVLGRETEALNKQFIDRMNRKRPYITLKLAQSLDGKIATKRGDSKWISSEEARAIVQRLRSRHDATMVGINTILRDDPSLNVRLLKSTVDSRQSTVDKLQRQPIKIVIDSRLRTPADAKLFNSPHARVIIAATKNASKAKEDILTARGARILRINNGAGRVDIKELMRSLGEMGITSILAEGGGELAASLFKERLVDKLVLFIAPILIGGRDAVTSFEGEGIERIKDALQLDDIKLKRIGKDILIESCLRA